MKDYATIVGTDEAATFADRVVDANEWLAEHIESMPTYTGPRRSVIIQDPCHLRHVQRIEAPVRTLLNHVVDVVELDDDGLCCGAGGAYSALQPKLAADIRDRKVASIDRAVVASNASLLASANPGCSMHLAQALTERGIEVQHPVDIVAEALRTNSSL
jgi:glycolate oxidase iron-sulfur subunit